MRVVLLLFLVVVGKGLFAQTIQMHWPAFAGKHYEFTIFQGDKSVLAQKAVIPNDGRFELTVPAEYAPYTGMSRWLLMGTAEGGGLDMSIPGHDFSVSCTAVLPDESNIEYRGHDAVNELNRLDRAQMQIIGKHSTMLSALGQYDTKHPLYKVFDTERRAQEKAYAAFQKSLAGNSQYAARILPVLNLTKGIVPRLYDNEEYRLREMARYIAFDMDTDVLYTSGHWSGIIGSWVQLHLNVVKDDTVLVEQFAAITNRMTNPKLYTDFVGKVTYFLTQYGKDDLIAGIASTVVNSGKITAYEGKTMQVYVQALVGSQAPDIALPDGKVLKSHELAIENTEQTLIVFFASDCGHCEEMMKQLQAQYKTLQDRHIRIIALSADTDEAVFLKAKSSFPWADTHCDFKGMSGINFKIFAVPGTPTFILLDKQGKVELRAATLKEVIGFVST